MKKILSLSLAVAIAFTFFPALAPPARAAAGDVMVNFSSTGSGTIAAAASTTGSLSSGDALDSDDAEIITFTATPHPGYRVKEWSGAAAGTSSASSTFTCTADTPGLISVYVEFEAIPPQPTVTSVLPTGAGVPVSGNVTITFNTAMNTSVSGAVTLNSTAGNVSLSSGTWTSSTVYSIPYSGLANNTTYTFSIDNGFRDPAGNTATYTGSNSFTTAAAATVTYKRNRNASDAVSSTDTVTSSPYTIKSDLQLSFDNPGYTFNNWFTAASGGTPYAAGGSYPITTDLTLYAQWTAASFVAVTDIKSVPTAATAGTPLTLTGTVEPSTATNKTIVWSVVNAGNTGATISGSTLTTTAAGTATIQATITNGATPTTSFTKTFNITVTGGIPKIDSVSLGSATDYTVGTAITTTLSGNTGGTPVYQWKRADSITGTGSNISGANSPSYTPTGADFGKYVYVEVTPRSTTNQTVQGVVVRASTRAQIGLRITARVTGGGGGSVTINGGAGSTGTVVYNRNNITLSVTKNTPADPVSWSANPAIGAFGTPTSTVTTSPVTTTYTPPAAPSGNIVITATLASANQTKINNARQRLGWYSSSSGYVNICG
ncbi:MAG: Ig-like domain-containing protein, partial [Oscillospiraceae bacterium]|nr:Ig-like domain-containing protein [Oscillospiraceae bacterium]